MTIFDKQQVTASFAKAAPQYEQANVLQREIGERLLQRLQVMSAKPSIILDLGGGTGHLSRLLSQYCPQAQVYTLDIAYPMLVCAKQQANWQQQANFCCGDAEQIPFKSNTFDLVIANLLFHWCPDQAALLAEVQRVLQPGGLFLFTTLGPDTLGELRQSWAEVDDKPHVHDFMDMHNLGDNLLKYNFNNPVVDMENITLTYPNVRAIMQDLKTLGVHNLRADRHKALTGKSRLQAMQQAYEKYRLANGKFPVTYEVIYGHALAIQQTNLKKLNDSGEVHISVQDLMQTL